MKAEKQDQKFDSYIATMYLNIHGKMIVWFNR